MGIAVLRSGDTLADRITYSSDELLVKLQNIAENALSIFCL